MRANIPRTPPPSPAAELEGMYLQAMKEVSVRLMDTLPAGDDLWQMLGQVEVMLLEAQLREMPLSELFGNGGVAAFCQSIVDEYRTGGEITTPAARDRSVKPDRKPKEPRGGVNFRRHRIRTALLSGSAAFLMAALALWYTGILHYWMEGTSYYLDELHNFESTVTESAWDPIRVTLPLEKASGLSDTLYADAEGYDIILTAVETYDHAGSFTDPDTGKTTYRNLTGWYLRMTYTVDAGFRSVTYVEPPSTGTVTVTLKDGTTHTGKITWIESGEDSRGREFARISVIELPADTDTEGATLTVVLDPPCRVEWKRIRTGSR